MAGFDQYFSIMVGVEKEGVLQSAADCRAYLCENRRSGSFVNGAGGWVK